MRRKSAGAQGSGALCVSILFSLWAKFSITIKYPPVKARKNQRAQKDAQKRILHFIEVHRQNTIRRAQNAPRPGAGARRRPFPRSPRRAAQRQGRRLYTFDLAQEWIRDGIYKVEGFVTHHFKLDQYKDAFRLALQNSPEVIKIVLDCQ